MDAARKGLRKTQRIKRGNDDFRHSVSPSFPTRASRGTHCVKFDTAQDPLCGTKDIRDVPYTRSTECPFTSVAALHLGAFCPRMRAGLVTSRDMEETSLRMSLASLRSATLTMIGKKLCIRSCTSPI